ncbi:hypothetical protein JW921_08300 [Candidatus Fermentibacterales bacterium]|nr:hypothetical protein [Candidatus Fermentibacterales bacterium]
MTLLVPLCILLAQGPPVGDADTDPAEAAGFGACQWAYAVAADRGGCDRGELFCATDGYVLFPLGSGRGRWSLGGQVSALWGGGGALLGAGPMLAYRLDPDWSLRAGLEVFPLAIGGGMLRGPLIYGLRPSIGYRFLDLGLFLGHLSSGNGEHDESRVFAAAGLGLDLAPDLLGTEGLLMAIVAIAGVAVFASGEW